MKKSKKTLDNHPGGGSSPHPNALSVAGRSEMSAKSRRCHACGSADLVVLAGRVSSRCGRCRVQNRLAARRWAIVCAGCGVDAVVTARRARFCSHACAMTHKPRRSVAVVHVGPPDDLCHLPARHPARRRPRRRRSAENWVAFVAGRCVWCASSFVAPWMGGSATWPIYCSPRCRRAIAKRRAGRFAPSPAERRAVYERDGWVCQLCHDPVDPLVVSPDNWAASLDHIVPRSKGGGHDPANLRLAHRWCNAVLGDGSWYSEDDLAPGVRRA